MNNMRLTVHSQLSVGILSLVILESLYVLHCYHYYQDLGLPSKEVSKKIYIWHQKITIHHRLNQTNVSRRIHEVLKSLIQQSWQRIPYPQYLIRYIYIYIYTPCPEKKVPLYFCL